MSHGASKIFYLLLYLIMPKLTQAEKHEKEIAEIQSALDIAVSLCEKALRKESKKGKKSK